MKKLLALVMALVLMFTMALPVFAEISPTAEVITTTQPAPQTSPVTDSFNWIVLVAGSAAVCLTAALLASKKAAKDVA